jgi:hypothetical protein
MLNIRAKFFNQTLCGFYSFANEQWRVSIVILDICIAPVDVY